MLITTGLVEQHIHGCFGYDFMKCSVEDIIESANLLAKCGVTAFFPTVMTDDVSIIKERISTITTDVNTIYLAIAFNLDSTTTVTKLLLKDYEPQLEEGTEATSYEPYRKESFEVNLGKNLFDKDFAVDVLTVSEELENMKELENIGGPEYLAACSDSMVALSAVDYYINIVNDQAVLRRLIQSCRDIDHHFLNDEITDVNGFILDSETLLKDACEKRRVSGFRKAGQVAEAVKMSIETPKEVKTDGVNGLTTGFDSINKITQGFHAGDMIIVAARPSVGKTALALNFAYRAANRTNKIGRAHV